MKTLKEEIVGLFQKCGADIVRFGAAEACKDPAVLKLMPEAKTVICAAFRQLRGARRGIEEGSTYYQYTTNAVEVLEENVMPVALLRVSALLEDRGFEALPQRRSQLIMHEENSTNFEMNYQNVYRGKTAENMLDFATPRFFIVLTQSENARLEHSIARQMIGYHTSPSKYTSTLNPSRPFHKNRGKRYIDPIRN